MNLADDNQQHARRTFKAMRRFTLILSGFGAAGAAANARAELTSAHDTHLQAALLVRRVQQSVGPAGVPLTPVAVARVA